MYYLHEYTGERTWELKDSLKSSFTSTFPKPGGWKLQSISYTRHSRHTRERWPLSLISLMVLDSSCQHHFCCSIMPTIFLVENQWSSRGLYLQTAKIPVSSAERFQSCISSDFLCCKNLLIYGTFCSSSIWQFWSLHEVLDFLVLTCSVIDRMLRASSLRELGTVR